MDNGQNSYKSADCYFSEVLEGQPSKINCEVRTKKKKKTPLTFLVAVGRYFKKLNDQEYQLYQNRCGVLHHV